MQRHTIPWTLAAVVFATGCGQNDPGNTTQPVQGSASTSAIGHPSAETFHAKQLWDPYNILGHGAVGDLTLGTLFCPGTEPFLGDAGVPECPADAKKFTRNVVLYTRIESTPADARLDGFATIVLNQNWDADGTGRETSKWTWFVGPSANLYGTDSEDTWEGTAEGVRTTETTACQGSPYYGSLPGYIDQDHCWVSRYKLVGKGTAGAVAGLQVRFTITAYTYQLVPYAFIASVDGQIFTP